MNKNEFLHTLEKQLKGLPDTEVNDILADYTEHFDIGISHGRTEEDIAKGLGHPKMIAKEIKANYFVSQASESFTVNHFFQALISTIGLGFFNLIFVLGPFIAILGIIVGLGAGSLAIIATGLVALFAGFLYMKHILLGIFVGIALISLGLFFTILVYEGCKWFFKITIRYLQWNIDIIARRRVRHENN